MVLVKQGIVRLAPLFCLGLLLACQALPPLAQPAPVETAADVATPTLQVAATASPQPDSGWQQLSPGLEQRLIRLFTEDGRQREQITIFRLEPALFQFEIGYRPGEPQLLADWQAETGALLLANGGFFTEAYIATGLTTIEGQPSGTTYGDFAGTFVVTAAGPEVRWLGAQPYDPNEPLLYGLQSFPMLVKPGGVVGYTDEDNDRARRTVIGEDRDGRLLILVAPWGSFTLAELSRWLVQSDLDLDVALNLDGGTSTGLYLQNPVVEIPAFARLPIVISVQAK